MFDHQENPLDTNTVALVLNLFPGADEQTVSSLPLQSNALKHHLADSNHVTENEVQEVLGAFLSQTAAPSPLMDAS